MFSGNVLLRLLFVLGVTALATNALATGSAPDGRTARSGDCRRVTAQLRERLEGVTEACIDGRAADLAVAARRARTWWASRPAPWPTRAGSDSLLEAMLSAAKRRDSRGAALGAVKLSIDSFDWCDGPSGTTDDLMVLDLAGAVGWLRSRGESAEWPPALDGATNRVSAALARKGRTDLDSRLKKGMTDLLDVSDRAPGSTRVAVAFLDLVDELEKALR